MSQKITKMFLDSFKEDVDIKEKKKNISQNMDRKNHKRKKCKRKHESEQFLQSKNLKTFFEKCKKDHELDKTEESIKSLTKNTSKKISKDITTTVLVQNQGRLSKNNPKPEVKEEERTVFTDRDFDKFEQEYDFFS